MNITSETSKGVYTAHLRGKFTFNDSHEFRVILQALNEPGIEEVVVDLSRVEFIDSAGLGMLMLANDESKKKNKALYLRGMDGQVKRIFDLAHFEKLFSYK